MEKKVLHLVSNLNQGGVQNVLLNSLNKDFLFDFIVLFPNGSLEDKFRNNGSRIFNGPNFYIHPIKFYFFLKRLKSKYSYDLIHFHLNFACFIPLFISLILGFKGRIVHSHNDYPEKSIFKKMIKLLIKFQINLFSTHMIGCSITASNWLFGKSPLFSKKRYVIYNGINYSKFFFNPLIRNKIRKKFNYDDKFIIGNVANFSAQKNQFFFIQFVKRLKVSIPNLLVVLIGEGTTKEQFAKSITNENLEEYFLFLGKRDNINDFLCSFDLFLLPSLFEGLPVSVIEAQLNGLPVLLSDSVTKEVSLGNKCDFLSLRDEYSWIKKVLEYYYGNSKRLQEKEFNPLFKIELQINGFIDIYNNVIKVKS